MNIHEYQAKILLKEFGVPVPVGYPAFTAEEATQQAKKLQTEGNSVFVVKAQIHAGSKGSRTLVQVPATHVIKPTTLICSKSKNRGSHVN